MIEKIISKKKVWVIGIVFLFVIFYGGVACFLWVKIFHSTARKTTIILLEKPTEIKTISSKLAQNLESIPGFLWAAKLKKISTIKTGRYEIKKGMSNVLILNRFINHIQKPIKLTFNNLHSLKKLSEKIAKKTICDKRELYRCFTEESFLKKEGFTKETALAMYLPDTYEVYWDTTPQKFRAKMMTAYKNFWKGKRSEKAKKIGLSPIKVMILSSIVHMESKHKPELPIIAGLYLNRLKKKIPLQADPTIVFALKKINEQTGRKMRRVLKKDLKIKSPYNTYKNKNLPPGLISMPDKSAIDAVLTPKKHRYIYMCANAQKKGTHLFAASFREHKKNAQNYHRWLKKKGVKK